MKRLILILSLVMVQGLYSASPKSGSTTCPSAGAKRLVTVSTPAVIVTVQVPLGNTGSTIYLGDSTINSTTGIALNKGDSYTFSPASNSNSWNLYQMYFACSNANDTITWIYD